MSHVGFLFSGFFERELGFNHADSIPKVVGPVERYTDESESNGEGQDGGIECWWPLRAAERNKQSELATGAALVRTVLPSPIQQRGLRKKSEYRMKRKRQSTDYQELAKSSLKQP